MSWLSSLTGVHISPKGFSVEPGKLLTDAAALAIPGVGGAVAKGLGAIPGIGGALASGVGSVSGLGSKALGVLGIGGALGGGVPPNTGGIIPSTNGVWDDPTGGVLSGISGIGSAAGTGGAAGGASAAGGAGGLLGWLERNPALATAGASLIGNTVSGIGQGQIAKSNLAEQQREFNQNYGLNANAQAMTANRAAQASPLRDQAQYLLQQRMGLAPQAFQPHDIYNPTTSAASPQMGGVNLAQVGQRASQYRPGMGGQSSSVQQDILKRLGYPSGAAA